MYKSKHTGEQVDRLLKDVFDSTLQTKDIDVTENGVIEVTPDEGYLGLAKVNVNVEVPTGGNSGGELEGEYYLAKPNGRYWKSKLSHMMRDKYPVIEIYPSLTLTDEEINVLYTYCYLFQYFGYTAIYDDGGIPFDGSDVLLKSPAEVSQRTIHDVATIDSYLQGQTNYSSLMGAWQECSIISSSIGGMEVSLVDMLRMEMGEEAANMSDDEIIALISEMFMLEQVTKEEYESYYNWE